jgi:hypothetical protein
MPVRLEPQILNHNPGEHNKLRVEIIQDLPIRQVEPIRDLLADPREILMRIKEPDCRARVPLV